MYAIFVFTTKTTQPCPHIHINCKHLNWGVNLSELDYAEGLMSKDLARQIARDLHSYCFAMVFTLIPGLIMCGKFEWSNT